MTGESLMSAKLQLYTMQYSSIESKLSHKIIHQFHPNYSITIHSINITAVINSRPQVIKNKAKLSTDMRQLWITILVRPESQLEKFVGCNPPGLLKNKEVAKTGHLKASLW